MKYFLSAVLSVIFLELLGITIHIAYENKEQPPFYLKNSNEIPEKPGVSVEMVLELENYFEDLNIKLSRAPWKRCKFYLKEGKVDGIFNASFRAERLKIGQYPMIGNKPDSTKRLTTISYHFYMIKGSKIEFDGQNVINLKSPIAAPRGYSIVQDLKDMGFEVEEADSTEQNLLKLLFNRVELTALQDVTADNIIKKNKKMRQKIIKVNPPLRTKAYYIMLSRQFVEKHPNLSQEIWNTVRKIRTEKLEEILQKY